MMEANEARQPANSTHSPESFASVLLDSSEALSNQQPELSTQSTESKLLTLKPKILSTGRITRSRGKDIYFSAPFHSF